MNETALVFVCIKDIFRLYPKIKTYAGARYRYNSIKKSLGKTRMQRLTLHELANWEGLEVERLLKLLQ